MYNKQHNNVLSGKRSSPNVIIKKYVDKIRYAPELDYPEETIM